MNDTLQQMIDEVNALTTAPTGLESSSYTLDEMAWYVKHEGVTLGTIGPCPGGGDHYHFFVNGEEFVGDDHPDAGSFQMILSQLGLLEVRTKAHAVALADWLVQQYQPNSLRPQPELPEELAKVILDNKLGSA